MSREEIVAYIARELNMPLASARLVWERAERCERAEAEVARLRGVERSITVSSDVATLATRLEKVERERNEAREAGQALAEAARAAREDPGLFRLGEDSSSAWERGSSAARGEADEDAAAIHAKLDAALAAWDEAQAG